MNVREMIEWLKTQPQDAVVEVVCTEAGRGRIEMSSTTETFKPELSEFYDWSGNKYIKESDPHFNKRVLTLGVQE